MGDHTKADILRIIEAAANKHGIPRDDFLRFAAIETGFAFNENAYNSSSGAKGLFQFMPDTAREYGISGREYDARANADAGARLYNDNKNDIIASHGRSGRPYLSAADTPNGFDLYMAHQQGPYGYRSIQAALDPAFNRFFNDTDTRTNIMGNIGNDVERLTGVKKSELRGLSDHDLAQTFVNYWQKKYNDVSIPEMSIAPIASAPHASGPNQHALADPDANGYYIAVVSAVEKAVTEGKLKMPEGVSAEDVASRMIVDASNQKLGTLDFSKPDSVSVNVSKDGTVGSLVQGTTQVSITPFSTVTPGEALTNVQQIDQTKSIPSPVLASASPTVDVPTVKMG
jgi:hypothetical protein